MGLEEPAFNSCAHTITALPAVGSTGDGGRAEGSEGLCGPAGTCRSPPSSAGMGERAGSPWLCCALTGHGSKAQGNLPLPAPCYRGRESWQNTQHSSTQPCFGNDGS